MQFWGFFFRVVCCQRIWAPDSGPAHWRDAQLLALQLTAASSSKLVHSWFSCYSIIHESEVRKTQKLEEIMAKLGVGESSEVFQGF